MLSALMGLAVLAAVLAIFATTKFGRRVAVRIGLRDHVAGAATSEDVEFLLLRCAGSRSSASASPTCAKPTPIAAQSESSSPNRSAPDRLPAAAVSEKPWRKGMDRSRSAVEVWVRRLASRRSARVAWSNNRPSPQEIRLDRLYERR